MFVLQSLPNVLADKSRLDSEETIGYTPVEK